MRQQRVRLCYLVMMLVALASDGFAQETESIGAKPIAETASDSPADSSTGALSTDRIDAQTPTSPSYVDPVTRYWQGPPGSSLPDLDPGVLVRRTLTTTTGFVAVCLLALAAVRKYRAARDSGATLANMAVLDTLALAPRCTLQLVRVESQKFLIARDANGVRSVTQVSTFADTLSDVDSSDAPVAAAPEPERNNLRAAASFGLSLERQHTASPWPA